MSLPQDKFEITVSNEGADVFEARKMGLAKIVDGEPRHILPTRSHRHSFAAVRVGPGETETREVSVDNTDHGRWKIDDIEGGLTGLGPGTYRFAPGGFDGDEVESMGFDMYHEHSVDIEFTGDYPALEPIHPDDHEVERDGDVVTVEWREHADDSEVVVRRTEEADDAREVIFEQVMRTPGLRNTLAFFEEDVTEVRLSPDVETDFYGVEDRFRFDGSVYEIQHLDE